MVMCYNVQGFIKIIQRLLYNFNKCMQKGKVMKDKNISLWLKLLRMVFAFSLLVVILDLYIEYRIPKIVQQETERTVDKMTGEIGKQITAAVDSYIEKNRTNWQDSVSEILDEKLSHNTAFQTKIATNLATLTNLNLPGQSPATFQDTSQVVLYEFMDYQCGFCKRFHTIVNTVKNTHPDLQVKYIDYPILGNMSVLSATIALALSDQGLYMDMHDSLMQKQGRLTPQVIKTIATDIGADTTKLETSLKKLDFVNVIRQNLQLGKDFGVSGTPFSIMISSNKDGKIVGEEINGYINDQTLIAMVEKYKND